MGRIKLTFSHFDIKKKVNGRWILTKEYHEERRDRERKPIPGTSEPITNLEIARRLYKPLKDPVKFVPRYISQR